MVLMNLVPVRISRNPTKFYGFNQNDMHILENTNCKKLCRYTKFIFLAKILLTIWLFTCILYFIDKHF